MDSTFPLVSIIMPTLNQGRFISQAIDSVLSQDYPNKELWVIDGSSNDETLSILKTYGENINWVSEKDNGQAQAINKGIALVKGEIFSYLNSDDYYLPGAFSHVVNKFKHHDVLWVTGDCKIVDENNFEIHKPIRFYKSILRKYSTKDLFLIANYIAQPSTFWCKSLMEKVGGFNENLLYAMDYEYWLRAFKVSPPNFTIQPLSAFRIYSKSKSGVDFKSQFEEELQVLERNKPHKYFFFLHRHHNKLITKVYSKIK